MRARSRRRSVEIGRARAPKTARVKRPRARARASVFCAPSVRRCSASSSLVVADAVARAFGGARCTRSSTLCAHVAVLIRAQTRERVCVSKRRSNDGGVDQRAVYHAHFKQCVTHLRRGRKCVAKVKQIAEQNTATAAVTANGGGDGDGDGGDGGDGGDDGGSGGGGGDGVWLAGCAVLTAVRRSSLAAECARTRTRAAACGFGALNRRRHRRHRRCSFCCCCCCRRRRRCRLLTSMPSSFLWSTAGDHSIFVSRFLLFKRAPLVTIARENANCLSQC